MISIIIPVYNALPTLAHCIESILTQTYSDFELLLINDGSTDNSGSICNDYAARDTRVRAIHQKNMGASLARRNGIDASQGDYLTFVDADDFLEPQYLELLADALLRYPEAKIAACGVVKHRKGDRYDVSSSDEVVCLDSAELHRRFFAYEFWGFWGKLYHRSVFDGIYFPVYTINEDYVVMVQLFQRYGQMIYVGAQLYHYIVSDVGLSHQHLSPRAMDEYYNKRWVVEYYVSEKLKINSEELISCAEAQLTETCIKLLRMIREADRRQYYAKEYQKMKTFLRTHLFAILRNRHLLVGLKAMAIKNALVR